MQRKLISAAVAAALLGSVTLLSGCATAPKTSSSVDQARAAIQSAEANPNVAKYSASEIGKARNLLTNAEGSLKANGNTAQTVHYAYLATQTAKIAERRAQEQAGIARIKAGETERQKILLSAREGEANRALADAQQARSQAEMAKTQAEQALNQAQNSEAERQRLAAQLEEMQASQTSRGIVLTLGDVLFDTGRSDLKSGAQRAIDQIAAFLTEYPERRVQIEGFTDSQGTNEYNLELSQRRADAVASAIIQRGIDAQRVRALGYGEEFPKAGNENAGSRQLNRRVEVVVSNTAAPIPERRASTP